jgi:hypothetical protein
MSNNSNAPTALDELDVAVELAVTEGQLASGVPARWVVANSHVPQAAAVLARPLQPEKCRRRKKPKAPEWPPAHDRYLARHLGFESEEEIARQL